MNLKLRVGKSLLFDFINEDDLILFRSGLLSVFFGIDKKFVPMDASEQVIFEQVMELAKETEILEETYEDENFEEFPNFENIVSYFLGANPSVQDISQMLDFARMLMRKSIQYALRTEEKVLRDSLLVFVVQWSVLVFALECAKQLGDTLKYVRK